MSDGNAYILTEIWKAKPAWLALSPQARGEFFEQKIGPLIGAIVGRGAEILGCALNNNTGPDRMDYDYMAVWKMPNKGLSDELENAARDAGFNQYFEQVNFSGNLIAPDVMNADMVSLGT